MPRETDWDELYDPARPTNVEEYLRSEERVREVRDWKAVLYALRRWGGGGGGVVVVVVVVWGGVRMRMGRGMVGGGGGRVSCAGKGGGVWRGKLTGYKQINSRHPRHSALRRRPCRRPARLLLLLLLLYHPTQPATTPTPGG
jgi:hypothetical protein